MTTTMTEQQGRTGEPAPEIPEVRFGAPMPGLDGLTRYALVRLDDVGGLFSLRSLDDPEVRLVVATPWLCAPGYAVDLDDDACRQIGLTRPEDAIVLLVVNPGPSLAESTVNLLAPIVVDAGTGQAAQVMQPDGDLPLRAPLLPV